MKKLFSLFISMVLYTHLSFGQDNSNVTITACGQGETQSEAQQAALRNAIEQAFGTFISAKTEILNDELVSDQITSVSNGNIQSFQILNESELPNGKWYTTMKAVVSVEKLTSFVQSKGVTVEIKGGVFAANIKQQMLNEQGEIDAIYNMIGVLHELMEYSFDFKINLETPQSIDQNNQKWKISYEIQATANKNMEFCHDYFVKTLSSLALNESEIKDYANLKKQIFTIEVNSILNPKINVFKLRKITSIEIIITFLNQWRYYSTNCRVHNGIDIRSIKYNQLLEANSYKFSNFSFTYIREGITFDPTWGKTSEKLSVNFPSSGTLAATVIASETRSLSEIEKISEFHIEKGAEQIISYGGFEISDDPEHSTIVAFIDLGKMNWSDAKKTCEELNLGGFSDWRLPSIDELEIIQAEFVSSGIGNFRLEEFSGNNYWSNSTIQRETYLNSGVKTTRVQFMNLETGKVNELLPESSSTYKVRPVRDVWFEAIDESQE